MRGLGDSAQQEGREDMGEEMTGGILYSRGDGGQKGERD